MIFWPTLLLGRQSSIHRSFALSSLSSLRRNRLPINERKYVSSVHRGRPRSWANIDNVHRRRQRGMSTVQLLQIPVSPGTDWKQAVTRLQKAKGCVQVAHALQHEDENVVGIAATWNNAASRNAFEASEEGKHLKSVVTSLATGPVYEDVVLFTEDAQPTMAAQVVELVSWIHPASNLSKELEENILRDFTHFQKAISTQAPESDGGLVAGWGQIEFEHKGTPSRRFTSFIGWKSVKAHYDCKETKPFLDNIHWLMENNDTGVEMVHYAYSQSL